MRDRAWFVRMYGEIIPKLSRVANQPYWLSNHLICTMISRVDHARYEVPCAQELGTCIWGPCYNSTLYATGINIICVAGKNINPRVQFKIKAPYIVSTEGDVRRVTVLAVEAT